MATIAHSHCENCYTGVKHTGDPVGKTITIADVPTYLSEPPSGTTSGSKKVVLYFSDVFGALFVNNQLIQDYFASHGFTVLGIDYFLGDAYYLHTDEEGFDFMTWVGEKRKKADEITPKWLEEVRKLYGSDTKYCAVGYCFGAPFVMNLGATDDIMAAAFAHPGLLDENHFKNLKQPLLMSCAESDFTFPTDLRRRAEDILVERKAQYEIQVFSGVEHGFAVRGDLANPDIRWAKEECARGIIGWFMRFSA
ncbi:dienelactone hydrolase family-domain-containing protein [Mycena crocata]|nr:dienelactone hydrolase family-domain-containing protein [Mycena crocata]